MRQTVPILLAIICIIGVVCSGFMSVTDTQPAIAVYGAIAGKIAFPIFFLIFLFDYLSVKKENARLKSEIA
ncbi:hypothetical protein [Corynebacterium glucuronolyticum]|uniref:hypothetical protein n=1 Tax=Corynebacterium glucuronolyticum TaxID=39791 RepID=UPI00223AB9A5|nr:hypothetical protein [Corynebacterium glucuronolyticum]MCT1564531.1 hypothetical protein [Corynebacterium glucuronolyticum]